MYYNLYEKITQALAEDGIIIVDNTLSTSLAKELSMLSLSKESYKQAGISNSLALHIDRNRRKDKICWLNQDIEAEKQFLEFISGLQKYLNRELYLGLSYNEAHFAKYEAGDFYEKHLDSFRDSKNRVVTAVYYLNKNYSKENRGELVVYDKENRYLTTVEPEFNRLVVFLSENFPHEVKPTNCTRTSIAIWFRVDK